MRLYNYIFKCKSENTSKTKYVLRNVETKQRNLASIKGKSVGSDILSWNAKFQKSNDKLQD